MSCMRKCDFDARKLETSLSKNSCYSFSLEHSVPQIPLAANHVLRFETTKRENSSEKRTSSSALDTATKGDSSERKPISMGSRRAGREEVPFGDAEVESRDNSYR